MVFCVIKVFPRLRQRAQVMEILQGVHDLTEAHPDCLGCWLRDQDEVHDHIRYAEEWATEDGLSEHVRSDLYRRVLAALDLSSRPPEVQFHFSSVSKGMDLIHSLRQPMRTEGVA
jgi:quinol monooxygenase YgiN